MPPKRSKTIEETYQKLSQLEHVLLRPDSYVGSIEMQKDSLYVYDEKTEEMVWKDVKYIPGLYKIFDEVLVNAADNYVRNPASQTYIKITIDESAGSVCVHNNGQGVPIELHQEHQMYVPEMIFGHLLTSDNYDDDEKKVTGGRNGYGAKLANIFSTRFEVECADSVSSKKYQQAWGDNMRKKDKPKITAHKGESYTKVTFWPDFPRFGMKKLDGDILSIMKRRCFDVAGATPKRCRVFLNGTQLEVKEFKDYVDLYVQREDASQTVFERANERWEIGMAISDGQFRQVSFVNCISTPKGGTHVSHVADQLVDAILKKANSKNRGGMELKPYHVKNYLWLFVNCQVENPSFDSQTKDTMTLKQAKFGSKCEISDAMINKVLKTGIVDSVLQWAKAKEEIDLGKTMKGGSGGVLRGKPKRLYIPKLEDANLAGGSQGHECTLILTEGDSAKALAVAGLSVIGRDRYGVFPLRGKLLNVREASFKQTMDNAEIVNITKIMGIEPKKDYKSVRQLRYGKLMVMADQDYDGSHIKGLIINLVNFWWPSLFQLPGFMNEFVTPIVKVTKKNSVQQFFTMPEYEAWKDSNNGGRGWTIKYYKGLGTSTTQEAKEYFTNIVGHTLAFDYNDDNDGEQIDLAFNRKRADDRKDWINAVEDGVFVDHSQSSLSYSDFVQKELVLFAKYDVMRNIPSVVDGLKPVQRKIFWSAMKRNLKTDMKVAQLAGYVSEHAAYHHGEASLQGAIINLAQDFVGSNNVNLLTPSGQFGTRLQGGKDAASPRYIYTRLEKIARLIFHPDDDKLLEYQVEEGQRIEPTWYIPVIPLVMLNGAEGIGTGWATSMPNYNPRTIIKSLKQFIRCEPVDEMWCPWFSGFKGSILRSADKVDSYELVGVIEKRGPTTLEISELPVKKWTQDYKEFLQGLLPTEGPGSGQIEDFKEYHTEQTVHFEIKVSEAQMEKLERTGFEKAFKLRTSLATSNMVFFDKDGKIQKFSNEREVLESFAELRLQYYFKRKDYLLARLRQQLEVLSEKMRFIQMVIEEKLKVKNRKKEALIEDLRKNDFRTLHEITDEDDVEDSQEDGEQDSAEQGGQKKKKRRGGGWEYLLGMPLWSLTKERIQDLQRQKDAKAQELEDLEFTAPEELWERDLDAILDELDARDLRASVSAEEARRICRGAKRAADSGKGRGKSKRRRTDAPPPVSTLGRPRSAASNPKALQELQDRQLAGSAEKFPTLFRDLATSRLAKPPAQRGAADAQGNTRLGFAQRAGFGRGRGRPPAQTSEPVDSNALQQQLQKNIDTGGLYAGAVVSLQGLQTVDMNGRRGTLRQRDEESGRWEVEVEGQGVKRLRVENLQLVGSRSK